VAEAFPIRFGRYELIERLAVGGMAELFRARVAGAEGFEKIVVIKKLLPHMAADPHFHAMFVDEAKITARLVHPKIAQTYELGREDDHLYIAMEFVDGIDALALLRECAHRRSRLPAPIAVHISREMLDALDFAHHQTDATGKPLGLVHRDVSPSNVLLSRRGDVKLIDFGIARANESENKTKAGTLKGKYGYMSPEQVIGEPLDARSDVFSAGIVMAELLTGRRLFAAPNELDVLLMVRDAKLDRLDRYGVHIDAALGAVLRRSLRKNRDERWASAGAFRDALDEWMFEHRHRIGQRDMAEVVDAVYEDAWQRKRESVAQAAAAIDAIAASGAKLGDLAQQPLAATVVGHAAAPSDDDDIDGIPVGMPSVDSMPIVQVDSEETPPLELPEADAEAGAIGRALDLALAARSGRTPLPDRPPTEEETAVVAAPLDPGVSVRYGSIEDAVMAVSLQAPDPSATDFDGSDVAADKERPSARSGKLRLPTAEELAAVPRKPPALGEISEQPDEQGDLSVTAPIRALYRLLVAKSTGLLVATIGGIRKEIYVAEGVPLYVSSNIGKELFGEYLVAQGALSEGELAMALAMMPRYGGKLGDTLVGLGLMKPLDVFRMLARQVRDKLIDFCTWTKGDYRWFANRTNPREAFALDLDPWEVLGAGSTQLSDHLLESWAERVAEHKPRSAKNPHVSLHSFRLGKPLRDVYDTLSGARSVAALRARYTDDRERTQFMRLLYLLVQTDLAKL
jgi:eukaryotic-like serine/threonine-protein kinase